MSHLSINDLLWFTLHFLTCDFVITILFHSASCKAAVCNSPGNSWLAIPGFCQMACVQMESRNAQIRPKAAVNPDFPSSPDNKKGEAQGLSDSERCWCLLSKRERILFSIRLKISLTFCEISRIRCCGMLWRRQGQR